MNVDNKSPVSEYLIKLQLIVSNTEFKNKVEANKYETVEMSKEADLYINAVNETDNFASYQYDADYVAARLMEEFGNGEDLEKLKYMVANPHTIPQDIKNELRDEARAITIANYNERNRYYRTLLGLPTIDNNDPRKNDPMIRVPEEFCKRYSDQGILNPGMYIHEMSKEFQELFINSEFYTEALAKYPEARYLKYIGSNSIPVEVSRRTRDGDIMKINVNKLSTYHPKFGVINVTSDIVHTFVQVYNETHDYVFHTLRGEFDNIYANYDSFIRYLTIYLTIGNCLNEFMKSSSSLAHMNTITADRLFNLYGLPSVIMEGTSMIEFLKKFRLLLMDKGTNSVYRVKDLIGYEYTDIYSLIMVKQQVFENGKPVYVMINGESIPKQEIVFRRMGTTNEANSYFKFREPSKTYLERKFPDDGSDVEDRQISSGDPRWWETKEVNDALRDMNYTLSNSKYIQLSTHLSFTDIWFETVILLRGLLDSGNFTEFKRININYNINGMTEVSVFDAVLALMVLMNWNFGFEGNMYHSDIDSLWNGIYNCTPYEPGRTYIASDPTYPNEEYYVCRRYDGETIPKVYKINKTFTATSISEDVAEGNIIALSYNNLDPKERKNGNHYKLASFDFNVRKTKPEFYNSLSESIYLGPQFKLMVDKVIDNITDNVGEVIMTDVRLIYEYLEDKLRDTTTIDEYREVTDAYYNLFLVDPVRDWDRGLSADPYETIENDFDISNTDLMTFCNYFHQGNDPDLYVDYCGHEYPIWLWDVMNSDVKFLFVTYSSTEPVGDYMFNYPEFVECFNTALDGYSNEGIDGPTSTFPINIRANYRNIIKEKVELDLFLDEQGPATFGALLHQKNPLLYKYIDTLRKENNRESSILLMRSIIKALESYTNSNLSALEFAALGVENYIGILKEVISYFKSYMVEFTKDEFVYLIDNILDNGGNSNMIRLYDEIHHKTIIYRPKDSIALFDVSRSQTHYRVADDAHVGFLRDESIIRLKMTYSSLLSKGMVIWYDDGKKITKTPFEGLTNDTEVIANLVSDNNGSYKAILHKSNVDPDNYYGNKRKI